MGSIKDIPASVRIAQGVGLTTSAFLLGQVVTLSTCAVPALLHAPAPLLAKQWVTMFIQARTNGIITSLVPFAAFGYLAAYDHWYPRNLKLYSVAALAHLLIFPYTVTLLLGINNKIEEKNRSMAGTALDDATIEAGVKKEETVHSLVDRWGAIALGRAVLAAVGVSTGLMAVLQDKRVV